MRLMRTGCAGVLILAFAVPRPAEAAGRNEDYQGADAGCLIYSVGTVAIGMRFAFPYARLDTAAGRKDPWSGRIEPRVGGAVFLRIKDPDFAGVESGHVVVRCLPPGRYAVGDFSFGGSVLGLGSYRWRPSRPVSLPFSVRSGEATYIGTFMRAPSLETSLEPALGAAGYFVVADRGERDLPIAKRRLPHGMKVVTEVTDVTAFGMEALRAAAP